MLAKRINLRVYFALCLMACSTWYITHFICCYPFREYRDHEPLFLLSLQADPALEESWITDIYTQKKCLWAENQDVDTKPVLILNNFQFYIIELCQIYASTGFGLEDLFQIQHVC